MKTKFQSYYQLLRGTNLIFIMLIMYIVRYFLVVPWMRVCNDYPFFSDMMFHLLVVATVFIAAAGYAINDYYDQVIDGVNSTKKQVVGVSIPARVAYLLYWVLAVMGSLIGIFISYKVGQIKIGSIFIIASFMVYFYSLKYKRLLLWGNLVVAFLSALVLILPWLFEFFALYNRPAEFMDHASCLMVIRDISLLFFGFSFVMTLLREWIKDLEDIAGDEAGGRISLPIRFGVKKAKLIINLTILVFVLLLALIQWQMLVNQYTYVVYYSFVTISLPLVYLVAKLIKAESAPDFHFLSTIAKIIMLFGILMLVLSNFMIFNFQY
jgi:4-hydroxybenzoate polyprenyltransferase